MRSLFVFVFVSVLAAQLQAASTLFDRVVARGKGVEIKASQLDDTFIAYKSARAAAGQPVPDSPDEIKRIEGEILDSLIAQKLLLLRATDADRTAAATNATRFIEEKKKAAPSEASFKRQLLISGMTMESFEKEVNDQAIIKAVVDREVGAKLKITDEQIEKFYKDNPKFFEEPEKWKVAHIYLSLRDPASHEIIPEKDQAEKRKRIQDIQAKAKAGADFKTLVKEYSEHNLTKEIGGEQTFMHGQMPPEFEAATISMKPGQISDVVTTGLGWHVIKLIEQIPPKTTELAVAKSKIRETLIQQGVKDAMPDYVKQLRQEAGVEVLAAK